MNTTQTTTLWQAWRQHRDPDAFADLVSADMGYAADLTRRYGASLAEADDAVQDALVKLAGEGSDVPIQVGIRAWLCRRAVLAFKMHVRASGRRRTHERAVTQPEPPLAVGKALELKESVEEALATLAPNLRHAVVLRHLHDLDYGEMAHVLGISRNACRLRVFKGLRALRTNLGGEAATLVALVGVPAFTPSVVPASIAATTSSAAAAGAGTAAAASAGVGGKTLATVSVLVIAAAGGAALLTGDKTPPATPPAIVVAAEPPPSVAVPAPPASPPRPPATAPQPSVPARSAASQPALDLLREHLEEEADAGPTMRDFAAVDRLLGAPAGRTLRLADGGGALLLHRLPTDVTRLELGRGIWTIPRALKFTNMRSLELIGRGAEQTLLRRPRGVAVQMTGEAGGLRVRNVTVEGGIFLDIRGRGAATFSGVRFRGWQDLAGHSAPVGISGQALLGFRDCTFVGGYRKGAGGSALSVRGASLALFDACLFADLDQILANGHPGAPHPQGLAELIDCTIENARVVREDDRGPRAYPIRLRGSTIRFGLTREPLADRRRVFGVDRLTSPPKTDFAQEPARLTLADIRRFLQQDPDTTAEVWSVEARSYHGAPHQRLVVRRWQERDDGEGRVFELDASAFRATPDSDERIHYAPALRPARGRTLLSLLEEAWPGLDPAEPTGGIAIHRRAGGTPVLVLLNPWGRSR